MGFLVLGLRLGEREIYIVKSKRCSLGFNQNDVRFGFNRVIYKYKN